MSSSERWKQEWLAATGAKIGVDHPVFAGVDWESLEVYSESGAALPYVLASITGDRRPPYAFGHLENACFHQGSVASSAKHVARVLVAMLDAGLGSRSEILEILTSLPFSRFLSKAQRVKYGVTGKPAASDGKTTGLLKVDGSKLLCEYEMKEGELDGPFVAYWKEGVKAREGAYERGTKIGRWRIYHPQGWLQEEGDFRDGKKDGLWTTYESLGKKLREETFVKGKLEGPFRSYYFNGKQKEEGQYRAGKKDGVWREWHFSGGKKRVSTFAKGKERPPIEAWDEAGRPIDPS